MVFKELFQTDHYLNLISCVKADNLARGTLLKPALKLKKKTQSRIDYEKFSHY